MLSLAKQPAKKPGPASEARRKRIVSAVTAAKKTVTEAARDEGITRSHASVLVNKPESRAEIAALVDRSAEATAALIVTALTAIAESFAATKQVVVQHSEKDGEKQSRSSEVLDLGADHFVRLTAVKRLIELMTAGRPVPKPQAADEGAGGVSLEQLTVWADRYWLTKGKS